MTFFPFSSLLHFLLSSLSSLSLLSLLFLLFLDRSYTYAPDECANVDAVLPHARPPGQWLDEQRLVTALDGMNYSIYYESARAEQLQTNGLLANMLTESKVGVASAVHTYYKSMDEDPTPHMAAFMLGQAENWYYFGSTGWWDDSYAWTDLYDKASACGKPQGLAKNTSLLYTRDFEHCSVQLDCRNASANSCVGNITWAKEE